MGLRLLLAIFLGGGAGGLARAALERGWPADGHSWPWGTFAVKVPAGTSSGQRLRIKGQGVKTSKGDVGDLYAEIQIAVPATLDAASEQLVRQFDELNRLNPRTGLSW